MYIFYYLTYICNMIYSYDHVRISPGQQIGPHTAAEWELSYIITGSGIRTVGNTKEEFHPGEVILIPPGLEHHWAFDPDDVDAGGCIENISFHFSQAFLEGIEVAFPELGQSVAFLKALQEGISFQGKPLRAVQQKLVEASNCKGASRAGILLGIIGLLGETGGRRAVGNDPRTDLPAMRMERARIFVACNFNRKIPLDEVAAYVGMNKSAFCTFFKRMTGESFVSYLNRYRIEKAEEMLRGNKRQRSVSDIAAACGFSEPAHFTRTFHRLKGVAPSKV